MDTKKLRQKILDLAIRGKLVPQDPNDEPASVLLDRIRAEKERLIAEGKIKRSKSSKATSDASHYRNFEPPFEIPESWEWTTLGEISEIKGGTTIPQEQERTTGNIMYIKVSDLNLADNQVEIVKSNRYANEWKYSQEIKANSIIFPKRGGAIKTNKKRIAHTKLLADLNLMSIHPFYCLDYLFLWFNAKDLSSFASGSNIPQINNQDLEPILIPIPPYSEQVRICAKVNQLALLISQISNESKILSAQITCVKSKILDLAISGKLVPQNPNDEPVIDALRRINPNFKPCDNPHFKKLPKGWCYCDGRNLFETMFSTKPQGATFKYIDIDSINNKSGVIKPKVIKTENAPSRASRHTKKGDILFSMVRPYLRNIGVVTENDCIASTGFYVYKPSGAICYEYARYLLISDYVVNGLNTFMKGDNSPSISKTDVEQFMYPVPPMNEQKRIAKFIDELFALLDNIQNSLEA